jgi:hypothetical protein
MSRKAPPEKKAAQSRATLRGNNDDNGLSINLSARIGQVPNSEIAAAEVTGAPVTALPIGEPAVSPKVIIAAGQSKRVKSNPTRSDFRQTGRANARNRVLAEIRCRNSRPATGGKEGIL